MSGGVIFYREDLHIKVKYYTNVTIGSSCTIKEVNLNSVASNAVAEDDTTLRWADVNCCGRANEDPPLWCAVPEGEEKMELAQGRHQSSE
jgi:hypothetical protein